MRKLKRITIKEEFVALTGDPIKAIILNQFIYWSERVADFDEFIAEEKVRAEQSGLSVTMEPTNGWIYKTAEELAEETMLNISQATVLRHVKFLVVNGWLDERNNPVHKWDRTKQYRVNLLKIHKDLVEIGYTLQDYKIELPFFKMKNASFEMKNGISKMENRTLQNEKAIPEITTENKSIHSSIHHKVDDRASVKRILSDAGFEGSKVEVEFLTRWFPVFTQDMIEYAFRKAVLNGKKSLSYIGGIFESWVEKGVETVAQAERETRYDSILKTSMGKDNRRDRGREIKLPDPQVFREYVNRHG